MLTRSLLLCAFLFLSLFTTHAVAGEYRHGLGASLLTGFDDVIDLHEDNLEAQGFIVEDIGALLPIGLTYQPYFRMDNGLAIGGGIGPIMAIAAETLGGSADFIFTNIPVHLDIRYGYVGENSNIIPYIKAGIRKNIASGDFVVSDSPGLFASIGIEFKTRSENKNSFILEIGVDKSEIEFEDLATAGNRTVNASDTVISFLVVF